MARGGLSLFVRYLRHIEIFPQIETFFGSMRRSHKGPPIIEIFKQDVCAPVLEPVCYATTLRRKVIDIAAKIVRHDGRVVLKVTAATFPERQNPLFDGQGILAGCLLRLNCSS